MIFVYITGTGRGRINALYTENSFSISTPDQSIVSNTSFEVPVYANNLTEGKAVLYQFDYDYDADKMQYQDYSTEGTLSSNGSIQVNPSENKLSVAWTGKTPSAGSGILLKLKFNAPESGVTTPVISQFLVNHNAMGHITNGTITIIPDNGEVPVGISGSLTKAIEMYPNPAIRFYISGTWWGILQFPFMICRAGKY